MRRREFLIVSSISAAAMSLASRADASASAHVIVYDSRYAVAHEFAQRRMEQGARAFSTDGCMVSLWRGQLLERVERGETRIAGFTTYSDFTIARDCARGHGLKVLEERWCKDCPGTFVSWLIGN